jgi:hypothetical protein
MAKRFAIGEEELQIAYLRSVNRGVVNFGDTTGIVRVPDPTRGRIRGADGKFGAVCPSGSIPGPPAARRGKLRFFIVLYAL